MVSRLVKGIKSSETLAISGRAREIKAEGKDVVDFGVGEPDFPTPENIKFAGIKAIRENFTHYTAASGILDLKKAIAEKLKNVNDLKYEKEQIIVSCGGKHCLHNVMVSILDPGDEVLIHSPYWVSYVEQARLAGASPILVPTDKNYEVKADLIEERITGKSRVLILNSPANPTGVVCKQKELERIADVVLNHDLWVVSDEVYEFFVYDGCKHISIASLGREIFDRTIICNSLSKTYAMTGWRVGYAAGPEEVVEAMGSLQSHTTSNPSSISQMAALEALNGPQEHISTMVEEFDRRRKYVIKRLKEIENIRCITPNGAFYVFPDIRETGISSRVFASKFLDNYLVAVVPGSAFGCDGNVRLSYATSMSTIEKGMDRLEKFCQIFR